MQSVSIAISGYIGVPLVHCVAGELGGSEEGFRVSCLRASIRTRSLSIEAAGGSTMHASQERSGRWIGIAAGLASTGDGIVKQSIIRSLRLAS